MPIDERTWKHTNQSCNSCSSCHCGTEKRQGGHRLSDGTPRCVRHQPTSKHLLCLAVSFTEKVHRSAERILVHGNDLQRSTEARQEEKKEGVKDRQHPLVKTSNGETVNATHGMSTFTDLLVHINIEVRLRYVANIGSDEKWRLQSGPNREVRNVLKTPEILASNRPHPIISHATNLVMSHAAVANLEPAGRQRGSHDVNATTRHRTCSHVRIVPRA